MVSRIFQFSLFCVCPLTLGLVAVPLSAQVDSTTTGAELFPDSTAVYLQLNDGGKLLDAILNHPAREQVEKIDGYRKLISSPQMMGVQFVISIIEGQLEQSWQEAVRNVSANVYLCVDLETRGVALLMRAHDEAKLKRTAGTLLGWIRSEAEKRGDNPPQVKMYRDVKVADFDGKAVMGRWNNWLLLSNQGQLAKTIADNLMDHAPGAKGRLSTRPWFQQASEMNRGQQVWGAVDLEQVRSRGVARELFSGKASNPAVELILGGVLDGLQDADFAVLAADLERNLSVTATIPFQPQSAQAARQFFYGPDFGGRAPRPLAPQNVIANLVSYRDIGAWWLAKEDLYEENVIAQLSQADSQLSTLFAGLDFGQEVLGAIQPGVQIVVTEQQLPAEYDPDIKLPAFALIAKLKDPAIQRRLKVAFQSVIGFANINLGMQGQPQLEIETVREDGALITHSQYLLEEDADRGLLLYNFSPSLAFRDEYLVISSTRALARELVDLAKTAGTGGGDSNTRLEVSAAPLHRVLSVNRESLIGQNMIEEGNSREQAEEETGLLLSILELIHKSRLDLQVTDDRMQLAWDLVFDD